MEEKRGMGCIEDIYIQYVNPSNAREPTTGRSSDRTRPPPLPTPTNPPPRLLFSPKFFSCLHVHIIYFQSHSSFLPHTLSTMSDVAHLKSLLGVHPDFPKKVRGLYLFLLSFPSLAHSTACQQKKKHTHRASPSLTSSPSFATLSPLRASLLTSFPTSSTLTK